MTRHTKTLGAAMCRGLIPHPWEPRNDELGIVITDGSAHVVEDCPRCHSVRREHINMTTGKKTMSYSQSQEFQLILGKDEDRPTRETLRLEAVDWLIEDRKSHGVYRRTTSKPRQRKVA